MQSKKTEETVTVFYQKSARFGEQSKVSTILPKLARDLDIDAFDEFQKFHRGKVETVSLREGVRLSLVVKVGSETSEELAQKFADSITKHLGFPAEISPAVVSA